MGSEIESNNITKLKTRIDQKVSNMTQKRGNKIRTGDQQIPTKKKRTERAARFLKEVTPDGYRIRKHRREEKGLSRKNTKVYSCSMYAGS